MAETPVVVNLFTHQADWREKIQQAFKTRKEVIVLGIPAEPSRAREIARLCEEAGYTTPASVPESDWPKYQRELNLGGLATKEQGFAPNAILSCRPR